MYPPNHIIRFFLAFLEELFHMQGQLRRENASVPYTSWKGEMPRDIFVVTLSAHIANLIFESHAFLLSSNSLLMILMRLLLEDFANPLPLDSRG
jgi:hypothetical protein